MKKTGIAIAFTLLTAAAGQAQTLSFVGGTDISTQFNPAFYEASGLGLTKNQNGLWSISDGELKVYKLNLNGTSAESFVPTPVNSGSTVGSIDFEGVTYAPPPSGITDDHFIYIANEAAQGILPVNYSTQQYYAQKLLSNMTGYSSVGCTGGGTVSSAFSGSDANSGLEGITWDGTYFYVIKEKDPGLIVRISANLTQILACKILSLPSATDYSDISYDPTRGKFWIASDEAENVYLYDWSTNSMVKGWHLGIANMEGIAFNPSDSRLSIATDNGDGSDSYLYVYSVQ
ncbi:MAG TPA: SdiA-regulated domain-containing protein [Thermoanaerobaculia bacterium]|nr:SdiA-regulated domain-containing protein [Thermoanaerobaculia bacterium]